MGGNQTGKVWDETSRRDKYKIDVPRACPVGLNHKNVFTRVRSTYTLVRTLTLGVRTQAIKPPIHCYSRTISLATGRQSHTRLDEHAESRQLGISKKAANRG